MHRGSSPTNIIAVDLDLRTAKLYVTYAQEAKNGEMVNLFEKVNADIDIDEKYLAVHLTQRDTLSFIEGPAYIQIRGVFPDESTVTSNIMVADVEDILKDGEIFYA